MTKTLGKVALMAVLSAAASCGDASSSSPAHDEMTLACGIGDRFADLQLDGLKPFDDDRDIGDSTLEEIGIQLALVQAAGARDESYASAAATAKDLSTEMLANLRFEDVDDRRTTLLDDCPDTVKLSDSLTERVRSYVKTACAVAPSLADAKLPAKPTDPATAEARVIGKIGLLAGNHDGPKDFADAARAVSGPVLSSSADAEKVDVALSDLDRACT